ncbi:hypothetical protein BDZ89DRAFT_1116382 [Hymenopellis radicata]|nr:hypothetical protein BDZ89DRAFT_1116382 [Hymenopellis radicata]
MCNSLTYRSLCLEEARCDSSSLSCDELGGDLFDWKRRELGVCHYWRLRGRVLVTVYNSDDVNEYKYPNAKNIGMAPDTKVRGGEHYFGVTLTSTGFLLRHYLAQCSSSSVGGLTQKQPTWTTWRSIPRPVITKEAAVGYHRCSITQFRLHASGDESLKKTVGRTAGVRGLKRGSVETGLAGSMPPEKRFKSTSSSSTESSPSPHPHHQMFREEGSSSLLRVLTPIVATTVYSPAGSVPGIT